MKTPSCSLRRWTTAAAGCLLPLVLGPTARAAGFIEPPVVFYGTVSQSADGYTVPVTSGTVGWTVTPPTGAALTASAPLATVRGQAFYRLEIPVEKVPPGATASANTLAAPSAATSFGRAPTTLNGVTPLAVASPVGAAGGTFTFNESGRGKIDRVDLVFAAPFTDSDGNGLPDWWEGRYGLNNGGFVDPLSLDRHGRRTLLYDYQHHIDPLLGTEYEQWADNRLPAAAPKDPTADAEGDGVNNLLEFALDTDPQTADAGLFRQRVVQGMASVGSQRYLMLTVTLPAVPRATVSYVVESSGDLRTWGSTEGVDIVTVTSTTGQLQVRDVRALGDAANPRRFLRLRAVLTEP